MPMMNFRLLCPEHVVDLNQVRELAYVRRDDGRLAVGAMARQWAVENSAEVREHLPLLAETLRYVAHPPIRHRGTVVGSLAHASAAAELCCLAVALDAVLTLESASGVRTVSADEFFKGSFRTALQPGELVTQASFPLAVPGSGHAFVEFSRRHGNFPIAAAAVTLSLEGDRIADAAIALCGLGGRAVRARDAEERLRGQVPDRELVAAAAEQAVAGVAPSSGTDDDLFLHILPVRAAVPSWEYRSAVARTQVSRAISLALERVWGETT